MRPGSGGRQQVRIPNSQGKITECSLCNNETGNPLPCPLGEELPPWWRDGPSRAYGASPPDGPLYFSAFAERKKSPSERRQGPKSPARPGSVPLVGRASAERIAQVPLARNGYAPAQPLVRAARFGELLALPPADRRGRASIAICEGTELRIAISINGTDGETSPPTPRTPVSPSIWPCRCSGGAFHLPSSPLIEGCTGTRIMPDEAPPTTEPTREPICEKCGGALEQLTYLPGFDHPAFDIFHCIACGVVRWIAQEVE